MADKFRYEEFTWPEIRDAAAQNRVAVVPVGTVEQHGPHLPLGTDALTASEIARLAVKRLPEQAVLLPVVAYCFSAHQMDFAGTISVENDTVVRYVTEIGTSLAHHGFGKILLVNSGRANEPLLDAAARNVTNRTGSHCAVVTWWRLLPPDLMGELNPRELPDAAHAGALETSMMLYLRSDLVETAKAAPEPGFEPFAAPLAFQDRFSRHSRSGVQGDPAPASAEMGKRFVEAVVTRLVEAIAEFRAR